MPETAARLVPRAPFADWPVGLVFGDGDGLVWFAPPAVLCVQTHVARVDLRVGRAYLRTIRAVREVERPAIARAGGLRIYQDFRSLRVIDRDARTFFAQEARADFGRWNLVCNKIELPPQNPIVRATIQVVAKLGSQMGLPAFDLSVDLARELVRDGVTAPEPGPAYEARCASFANMVSARPL